MEKEIRDSEEESKLEEQHRQSHKEQMEGSRIAMHDTKQLYSRALACEGHGQMTETCGMV